MKIDNSHPDFENTICLLNDKWIRAAIAADDVEGWVDILDLQAMAPPIDNSSTIDPLATGEIIDNWTEVKLKRLYGKVEFRKVTAKP